MEFTAVLLLVVPIGAVATAFWARNKPSLEAARALFRGRNCAICGQHIPEPRLRSRTPALRGPDGTSVRWTDMTAGQLEDATVTHVPICWNCHVAEEFRRLYPERVTDRPAH